MLSSVAFLFSGVRISLEATISQSVHIEDLVPVGVQRLLDDGGRLRLFSTNGSHGEWIRKTC